VHDLAHFARVDVIDRTRAVAALLALKRSAAEPAQADHCNLLVC
jgi:hypothetical protein